MEIIFYNVYLIIKIQHYLSSFREWWIYVIFGCLLIISCSLLFSRKKRCSVIRDNASSILPGNAQHIGSREEQQDSFGFTDIYDEDFVREAGALCVLADGMGGMKGGKDASGIAVKAFLNSYSLLSKDLPIEKRLYISCFSANDEICEYAENHEIKDMVGTTLVAAVIKDNNLYWLSVGDSRIYLFEENSLIQLTTDHVYAKELDQKVNRGEISIDEAKSHPERNSLTSFLGLEEITEIDVGHRQGTLRKGSKVILCSDGVYGSLHYDDIQTIVASSSDSQEACDVLVRSVLNKNKPYQDNITVAIMTVV